MRNEWTAGDESAIRNQATEVRRFLAAVSRSEPGGLLRGFPDKCCKVASYCLGRRLARSGHGAGLEWVDAQRGVPGDSTDLENHRWLKVGEVDIDITADQFEECSGEPVLVARRSRWHAEFTVNVERRPFSELHGQRALHPEWFASLDGLFERMESELDGLPVPSDA